MTAPVLFSDRLILRPHHVDDFADVAALWAEPEVVKFISATPSTKSESWSRLLRYIGHWQALNYGYWVVCDRNDGSFLGEVGFADYQRDITPALPAVPEAGWVLAPKAHGRGIATEAVGRIHQWADSECDWEQTVAIFAADHLVSQNVARKLGYQAAGEAEHSGAKIKVMSRKKSAFA